MSNRSVVVGVTGGVAAYKAATLVSRLAQRDVDVQVVMTSPAEQFVGAATFAALSGRPVATAVFDSSAYPLGAHIEIARANALPYAFQAAVFTGSVDVALRASRRLAAAAVMVNDHTAFRVDWMPFAGLRESGYGTGGIPYTIRDMQLEKLTVIRSGEIA